MDKMDIAKRLREEAKKDRVRLIFGAAVVGILVLVLVFVIVGVTGSRSMAMAVLIPVITALFVIAVFLLLRLIVKMEKDSFAEGMHLVMESVPMVSALLDKKLKLVYCNREAPKMYGMRSRQEYYDNFFALMPEFQPNGRCSKDQIAIHMEAAFKNGKETFDWLRRLSNGDLIPTKVTFVSAYFQGEDHLLEFTKDLREEKAIRKKEDAIKERSQAILDSSPLLCILYDKDSNVLEVNKEAEKLFGISDKQMFANNFRSFLPKTQPDGSDSFQKSLDTLRQALRDGKIGRASCRERV